MELQPRENSNPIPVDLVMEILSRLPVKSIGRCLCVSKLWASILHLPYFTTLFTTRSSVQPHMLLAYCEEGQVLFFSSPQHKNPYENASSSPVTANYLSRVPYDGSSCHVNDPVHGLVCVTFIDNKESSKGHIICNPSTGQTLTLPKVKTTMDGVRSIFKLASFLVYDSIGKQFKVLSMEWNSGNTILGPQHQVLTLGTQKLEWRMTKCCIPHYLFPNWICINGVLYYRAVHLYTQISLIICFDAKSEEFSYIEVETTFKTSIMGGPLIIYNGKLGVLIFEFYPWTGRARSFELLVIGDFEKQEWSTHKYELPPTWKNVVGEGLLGFAGFFGTNTIVLSRYS